jgi:hypothetical protein
MEVYRRTERKNYEYIGKYSLVSRVDYVENRRGDNRRGEQERRQTPIQYLLSSKNITKLFNADVSKMQRRSITRMPTTIQ